MHVHAMFFKNLKHLTSAAQIGDSEMNYKFKTKPYEHQYKAFMEHRNQQFFALFMDMGCGKTKTTIDIAGYKYWVNQINAMIIIAPNNVHTQWVNEEIPKHCSVDYKCFIWDSVKINTKRYKKQFDDFIVSNVQALKIFAINIEAFQSNKIITYLKLFIDKYKCFIIIDESSRIKNPKAKRSKTLHQLSSVGHRCILTGTPAAKTPFDIWSQFEFLKNNFFGVNYFMFQHKYGVLMTGRNPITGGRYKTIIDEKTFNMIKSKIKKLKKEEDTDQLGLSHYEIISTIYGISIKDAVHIASSEKFKKYKNLEELKEKISFCTTSIKKEDCLDLPKKVYQKIYVDMSKEMQIVYTELKKKMFAKYAGQELSVQNKISLCIRLMQICGGFFPWSEEYEVNNTFAQRHIAEPIGTKNNKVEALINDLQEIDPDEQIIVWGHFVAELELLYESLSKNYTCCLFYGKTPQDKRDEIKKEFLNGKYKIFIASSNVGAFGLNLQVASLQYFYSNTFKTENRLQCEDRSHRIGAEKTCVYKDLIYKDSIDEKILKIIVEGKSINDYFKETPIERILE